MNISPPVIKFTVEYVPILFPLHLTSYRRNSIHYRGTSCSEQSYATFWESYKLFFPIFSLQMWLEYSFEHDEGLNKQKIMKSQNKHMVQKHGWIHFALYKLHPVYVGFNIFPWL